MTRAILTDVEGTTTAISFVHDVLFPYAAEALPAYVLAHEQAEDVAPLLDEVRAIAGEPDASAERVAVILVDWIAEDRKETPLKALQGQVWRNGYEKRHFTGHLYEDAIAGLKRWLDAGILLYVYSSGSEQAQRLIYGYSDGGDLTPLFSGYFDTRVGHKQETESYAAIAAAIDLPAGDILFLSDVAGELDAARRAGMQTCQLVRDDNVVRGDHAVARNFDEVTVV